jgi:hypothetical protein
MLIEVAAEHPRLEVPETVITVLAAGVTTITELVVLPVLQL